MWVREEEIKENLSVSERDIEIVALASWRVGALVEDGRSARLSEIPL